MSKGKIDSASFDEMRTQVQYAADCLVEIDTLWGEKFEDLNQAFITSGYLNDLYEDAKSNYYTLKKGVSAIANVASGAALGCAIGSVVPALGNIAGAIIGAVIGFFFGVYKFCTTDPTWITTSKEVFEQLLTNCVYGNDDCYIGIANLQTKVFNVQLSLEEIRTKINEFNHIYASLEDSMQEFKLNGTMTDDGVLLSVDTEITVDGQTIQTSVSEALNAFYTYQNTVMASRIEAEYISANYGIEIDYTTLVKNANGFVVNTLNSGLYSKEFILGVMPTYTPDFSAATNVVSQASGLEADEFQKALSTASGLIGMGAGLIGATYIGEIKKISPEDDSNGNNGNNSQDKSTGDNLNNNTNNNTTNNNNNNNNTNNNTNNNGNGYNNNQVIPNPKPSDNTSSSQSNSTQNKDDKSEEDVSKNDVVVEKVYETKDELPEKVENEIKKDYDDLARREYESQSDKEIAERRDSITKEVDSAFASGDFSDIKNKLKDMGYSEPEINQLCQDRDKLTLAMISGDQKAYMADRAKEMAKADGVSDFDSKYDEPAEFSDLTDGTANSILVNMSQDSEVNNAFENLTDAEEKYGETVAEAAVAVEAAVASKEIMNDLKTKFTDKFGTSDTTKWDKESAEEYNESVKDYNNKAKDAEDKIAKNKEAKEEYDKAKSEYVEAKEEFLEKVKESSVEDDSNIGSNSGGSGGIIDNSSNSNGVINNNVNTNTSDISNSGNTANGGSAGGYLGVNGQFPGLATEVPSDNSLYASENLGTDGLYRQDVNVVGTDGNVQVVTQTSEGASFLTNNPITYSDTYTPYTGNNTVNNTVSNVSMQSGIGPDDAQLLAALQIVEEEAKLK